MLKKVSIILLNYNGLKFNEDCINSLLNQSFQDFEIIFVDNVSTDGSVEIVEQLYKHEINNGKIQIIRNSINNGFAGGNNTGVRYANKNSEYIWLLNNDTVVDENALKYLVDGIESDEQLGAVGSLILDKGYEEQIRDELLKNKNLVTSSVLGESVFKKIESIDDILYTEVLSGCSLLYKKSICDYPFLDFYFAYAEDFYISWLLIKKGYELGFCTKSIINHFGSGSFGKEPSDFKLFYGNRNQLINLYLFYDNITLLKLLPLIILTQIAHIFVNAPIKRIKAKIKGINWIIKNIKDLNNIKKSNKINSKINDINFITILEFKFIDNISAYKFSKIKITIINLINKLFYYYINIIIK